MTLNAFGPNLRRVRVQRGISIAQIAEHTKIAPDLLEGLEKNDLSGWPVGIYARAFVRQYACAIGADPDGTVDEFCRWFPQGDRRAEPIVRGHAEIVGHTLEWQEADGIPVGEAERRGQPERSASAHRLQPQSPLAAIFSRLLRVVGKA